MNEKKWNQTDGMQLRLVPKQTFQMGSTHAHHGFESDNEGPPVAVSVANFYMSETTVTNEMFHRFVLETGYVTEAERLGLSFVFKGLINEEHREKIDGYSTDMTWWLDVEDASWRKPAGSGSRITDKMNHPVVQVTWNDAMAYAKWAGGRLPTEAEWEAAARGGEDGLEFQWGDELAPNGKHFANVWQGEFPHINNAEDGYVATAPADAFYQNKYGIRQMTGNVWEWCLNPARIDLAVFNEKSPQEFMEEVAENEVKDMATRGGSFLCHNSYCTRYRVAARNGNSGNSASSNTGFRYVVEAF